MDQTQSLTVLKSIARALHSHAAGCSGSTKITVGGEKVQVPCKRCVQAMEWFKEVPAPVLTELLSEPSSQPASFQFATLVQESVLKNGFISTGRARENQAAGMRFLKDYEENGGRLRGSDTDLGASPDFSKEIWRPLPLLEPVKVEA